MKRKNLAGHNERQNQMTNPDAEWPIGFMRTENNDPIYMGDVW